MLAPDRQMSHHALPTELDLHLVVNGGSKVYEGIMIAWNVTENIVDLKTLSE
jgi:hypothetical protein